MSLVYLYNGKSRDLRKIIVAILKSGIANDILKLNYVQNFSWNGNKLKKIESKLLVIKTNDEEKLVGFLSKNFSQLERLYLN